MRPLIGIPPCLDDRGRWRRGRDYHYLDAAYAEAVSRAGGAPVVVPPQRDPEALARRLEGLLVPGGDDLLPDRPYPDAVRFEPVPSGQLAFDRALLAAALERGLPVLGICYGMQLLALAGGGALLYDLPTDRPSAGEHRLAEPHGRHAVWVEAGTRLAHILGEGELPVNSLHHQAVAEPGRGTRVAARAADGVVEAIEREGETFALGVQWHPEKMPPDHADRLFAALVTAARSASVSPPPGRPASPPPAPGED